MIQIVARNTSMTEALQKADEVLQQSVQGITDVINNPGNINLDFADVQTVMENKGIAHIGIGYGKGDERAQEAVKMAVESPLLETTISGATDALVSLSGDITLVDTSDAISYIQELAGDNVNIIWGSRQDESMQDQIAVTVIATGLEAHEEERNGLFAKMNYAGMSGQRSQSRVSSQPATSFARPVAPQPTVRSVATPHPTTSSVGINPNARADFQRTLNTPVQPTPTVKQEDIRIPDFLKPKKK